MRYYNVAILGPDPGALATEPLFTERHVSLMPQDSESPLREVTENLKRFKPPRMTIGDMLSCLVLIRTDDLQVAISAIREWSELSSYHDVIFDLVYTAPYTVELIAALDCVPGDRRYLTSLFSVSPVTGNGYRLSEKEMTTICYGLIGSRTNQKISSGYFFVSLAECGMHGYPLLPSAALNRTGNGEYPEIQSGQLQVVLNRIIGEKTQPLPSDSTRYLSLDPGGGDGFNGREAVYPGAAELRRDHFDYLRRYVEFNVLPAEHGGSTNGGGAIGGGVPSGATGCGAIGGDHAGGGELTDLFLRMLRMPDVSYGNAYIDWLLELRRQLEENLVTDAKANLRAASVKEAAVAFDYVPAQTYWEWADFVHREYIVRIEDMVRCGYALKILEEIVQTLTKRIIKLKDELEAFKARYRNESRHVNDMQWQVCRIVDGFLPKEFYVPWNAAELKNARDRMIYNLIDTDSIIVFLSKLAREEGLSFDRQQIADMLGSIRKVYKDCLDNPLFTQPFPYESLRQRVSAGQISESVCYIVPGCKYAELLAGPCPDVVYSTETLARLVFHKVDNTDERLVELLTFMQQASASSGAKQEARDES